MTTIVIANPTLDAYGSDLQMLETVIALREVDWRVVAVSPRNGLLAERLLRLGAAVKQLDFPVLQRASSTPTGLALLGLKSLFALRRMIKTIRNSKADVLYVNTVTLPWWLAVGRLLRIPTICHVHEAEARESRAVRRALNLPLLLAHRVIVNSRTTQDSMTEVVSRLGDRAELVYNGIEPPPQSPPAMSESDSKRLIVVGRLSPRKAPQVAMEATALLRAQGRDVTLDLCGNPSEGMDWFHDQLRNRAGQPDLDGAVEFLGYTSPIWPALARAHVVLAPSLGESFGNAVVEAQMANRPVVASAVQGHLETVIDGVTGLLVPCEDPAAMAAAIARLLDDADLAQKLAKQGCETAIANFSASRYRQQIRSILSRTVAAGGTESGQSARRVPLSPDKAARARRN
jgi:glycosyltransferase involved in cell wall biosynthesis